MSALSASKSTGGGNAAFGRSSASTLGVGLGEPERVPDSDSDPDPDPDFKTGPILTVTVTVTLTLTLTLTPDRYLGRDVRGCLRAGASIGGRAHALGPLDTHQGQ